MKVLLINPPLTQYGSKVEIQTDEPLGLMYLAAYLRQNQVEVRIFDAFQGRPSIPIDDGFYKSGLPDADIRNTISDYRPDIVGIATMFTMHSKGVHDLAALIKDVSPDIYIICGGSHASALPETVLQDTNIDMVVIGEGEKTLLEIIRRYKPQLPLSGIAGTAVRNHDSITINPPREHVKNLDDLPPPARDMVDMNLYLGDLYRNLFAMRPPRANVITSRGCPCRCPYCSIHSIWKHTWRGLDAVKIVDEIESLVTTYHIREVAFQDDNLTLNKNRMHRICDELLRRNLNIKWCTPNGVAIWTLDEELIIKMKQSGCYKLTFGIETGSPATQKFIHKTHVDLDKSRDIIQYCNKVGLWTHSAFIIGFPYETRQDIQATIDYAVESDLDMAAFFIATPFPGTELYDIYKREGLLNMDLLENPKAIKWTGCQQRTMCNSKHFTSDQLAVFLQDAHRVFYASRKRKFLNPMRLLRKFTGIPEILYFLKLVRLYRSTVHSLTG